MMKAESGNLNLDQSCSSQ